MSSVFPDQNVGGIAVVDTQGNPTGAPGIINGYIPPSTYSVACALRYYGTDCTLVRFDPTLINALSSELLCFTATLNCNGAWDCSSVCNVGASFKAWTVSTAPPNGDCMAGLLWIIDDEIAKWFADNFDINKYFMANRGVRIIAGSNGYPSVIQSDLGTGVRPVLT